MSSSHQKSNEAKSTEALVSPTGVPYPRSKAGPRRCWKHPPQHPSACPTAASILGCQCQRTRYIPVLSECRKAYLPHLPRMSLNDGESRSVFRYSLTPGGHIALEKCFGTFFIDSNFTSHALPHVLHLEVLCFTTLYKKSRMLMQLL